MDQIGVRWGIAWIVIGLAVSVLGLFSPTRDFLLVVTAGFLIFSAAAVFYATQNGGRAVAQFVLGMVLFLGSTFAFMEFQFEPMGAVPIWLALIAAGANSLAGQSLSPLALLGQLIPVTVITATNVTRYELSVRLAVVILIVSAAFCVAGSLIGRSLLK